MCWKYEKETKSGCLDWFFNNFGDNLTIYEFLENGYSIIINDKKQFKKDFLSLLSKYKEENKLSFTQKKSHSLYPEWKEIDDLYKKYYKLLDKTKEE